MSEGDYEYELMRSELLGLPPPEKMPLPPTKPTVDDAEDTEVEEGNLSADQEVDIDNERLKNTSGGLDELNSILNVTQKKLNKFKVVCGSFTSLLKIRMAGSAKDDASSSNCSSRASIVSDTEGQAEKESTPTTDDTETVTNTMKPVRRTLPREVDMTKMVGSQIDTLDTLLNKAEQAEISMSMQNKQMREYRNK